MPGDDVIALHLLGAADLGVSPQGYRARLDELMHADDATRATALRMPRAEEHHKAMPPLESLLYHAPAVSRIWLIATRQDPPHDGDTFELARMLASVLRSDPGFFGTHDLAVEVVTVHRFALSAFYEAIRNHVIGSAGRVRAAIVGIGGGPVEGHLGVVLGCIAAGIVPRICATNRQDLAVDAGSFELVVQEGTPRWLVQAAAFDALARLDEERSAEWRMLATLRRLDWRAAHDAFDRLPPSRRREFKELQPPASACSDEPQRIAPADWTWYRSILESLLLRQVGSGEVSGLLLAAPAISTRMRELFARLQRSDPEAARSLQLRVGGFDFERLMRTPQKELGTSSVEQFARREDIRQLWMAGKDVDHGRDVQRERALRAARVADLGTPDPLTTALDYLGYGPWPLLPEDGLLVLKCVGKQDLGPDGSMPMLEAIRRGIGDIGAAVEQSHLRLLASSDTAPAADTVASAAEGTCGFGSARKIVTSGAADYLAARDAFLRAIAADPELGAAREVVVAINPGTKAMNLAAVAAGLQWGYDRGKAVRVASLRKLGSHVAGTDFVLDTGPATLVPARLAHDGAVQTVLDVALADLDFSLARTVLSAGSDVWSGFDALVSFFQNLAMAGVPLPLPPGDITVAELHRLGRRLTQPPKLLERGWRSVPAAVLWPARFALYATLADRDPWRAIYKIVAIAERCWPGAYGAGAPWRQPTLPACWQLWRWRNESPLGHEVWCCAPPAAEIKRVFRAAEQELRSVGLLPAEVDAADRQFLPRLRDAIIAHARALLSAEGNQSSFG